MTDPRMRERASDRRQRELGGQEASPGYSNNAESEYSRRTASGGKAEPGPSLRERQSMRHVDVMIVNVLGDLEKIETKMAREPDPTRAAKLAKQQEIKLRFLDKLRAEQCAL